MKNTACNILSERDDSLEALSHFETSLTPNFISKKILTDVMAFRRLAKSDHSCEGANCKACSSHHLVKILNAVRKNQPVTFVLPAFPGKSPNSEKVLGPLPDYAEMLSLKFLKNLARKIKHYYSPGIKIIICSDGRVFSDAVGMKEAHVTAYQTALDDMIEELQISEISTFNLDDVYSGLNFNEMRTLLMKKHGRSLESLKQKIKNGKEPHALAEEQEAHRMYCGITRFLFEDSLTPGQTQSRTSLQKDARVRAYEVIRRSNAWSELIEQQFPEAVRLSIHPQTCGAKKLGIRLIANESWMTPWHGVAVETSNGPILLKKSEAEARGAQLICTASGQPSHYRLNETSAQSSAGASHVL